MTTPNPSRSVSPEPTKGETLTVEDVGGLGRLIDERRVLRLTCEVLLRGEHPDEAWLYGTLARTTGEIEDVEREVLPAGEHRADFIAAWNAKCQELAAETARCTTIQSAYIPLVEAAEAQRDALRAALENIRNVAISYNGEYRHLANPLARAVYVIANNALPGQQQADT